MIAVDAALVLLALPGLAASAYLLVLAIFSRRPAAPPAAEPHLRFDLVVPAHDEESGIADTVRSLLALDYPPQLRRVRVVADNCSDATAERARAAGAEVLVRKDAERRGKGYALALAFARSLEERFADAVVVVDADTVATPNLLRAFAARLDRGARAVQAGYGVRNPDASWRTRLITVALALVNVVRSLGRDRLACSVGLKGNGMCFATALLAEVPHDAFSIVEDLEYGIRLGLAGHRVHFAGEAAVEGEMVSGGEAARSQRRRWEQGRRSIARQWGWNLVWRGLRAQDRLLVDLGLDLLVPPLAQLAGLTVVGLAASLWVAIAYRPLAAPWVWGAALLAQLAYVVRGWWVSGTGLRGLLALGYGPVYLAWKLATLSRVRRTPETWVRTERERRG